VAARRVPWWLTALAGAACLVLGGVLTADPFRSLRVLAALVAAALIASGLAELAASRLLALLWVVGGVVAAGAPGLTLRALAIVVGVALVAGGALEVRTAWSDDGDERFVRGLSGVANLVLGVLALSWPELTVLALAVLFGVRTVLFGFGQIALGWRVRRSPGAPATRRAWPRPLRLAGAVAVLLVALVGMAASIAVSRATPRRPGAFYAAPVPLPAGPPGTIIRSEILDGFHQGATTYRVLYLSTGYDGKPTAVSGLILVPDGPAPPGGRKVIAYTHGTVGVASGCAPSLAPSDEQPLFLEGGAALLAAGYVIAATDYQGLGTRGPHPYLVGDSEGESELDAVRAVRNLPQAHASSDFAIWGHSQGGQAALFTAQLATTYAPELHPFGVAAGAPVPDLVDLFKVNVKTTIGRALIAMALQSWERVYHDAKLDRIVKPAARPLIAKIANRCLYGRRELLGTVPSSLLLGFTFLRGPAWNTEPWKTIVTQNNPGRAPIRMPVLIVQGGADKIVDPPVTKRLVDRLCRAGESVELHVYPGVTHLETSHDAAPDVVRWIAGRFAGKPAPSTCA
jgi:uncharacterized membrane protein HdeD (DUF308 family)/pimeloyl-ACP methyl ester carboxylesterase